MKRILLGTISFQGAENSVAMALSNTVKTTAEMAARAGWSFDGTYRRMRIVHRLDVAEKATARHVDLEDADFDLLRKIVTEDAIYMAVDQGIVDLVDRVRHAEDVE
jgi:hypothetical protein